ncbi:LysR family transcriptional regulator [Streptomyces sp. Wb2n-11]|uniref:LysR family transcriptional regulator n=1 Tax=Streptomyces sp. Wb2n-11 TaxID=1030533 RepID=UPI0021002CD2|nr:LysR family transcriptional regulator [Streptomyces sp. Wb2n-11]
MINEKRFSAPRLDLLLTFLEVYRAGSLSAAAQRLGVTQPAVSGQLARLEGQLGEPLFVRSSKGVTPTARAAVLASRVGVHVDGLREAVTSGDAQPLLTGTVRIGGAAELMTLRVMPALAHLTRRGSGLMSPLGWPTTCCPHWPPTAWTSSSRPSDPSSRLSWHRHSSTRNSS